MKKITLMIMTALALASAVISCGKDGKADDPLADTGRTQRTENLLSNMKQQADTAGYMVGHEDATLYGIGWNGDSCRSDIHEITDDMPAVVGFNINGAERGDSLNADGISFERITKAAIEQFDRNSVVVMRWKAAKDDGQIYHMAEYLKSLVTPYGVAVPVILRLDDADKGVWEVIRERFDDAEVTNVLWCLPVAYDKVSALENLYPGDDFVDIIGIDAYAPQTDDTLQLQKWTQTFDKSLATLSAFARAHGRAAAVTATGQIGVQYKDWFTKCLATVTDKYSLTYVMLGRNNHFESHQFCVPFPGQHGVTDFAAFYNDKRTLFAKDINGLYLMK